MGEKTLRIGIGVDDLVVSRAGHLALRLNPQDWHREANLIEDIPVRLRARRKRQDPRTEKLLQSIATVLINSRCLSAASVQKSSRSCLKNVAQLPHHDEHPRHCLVCSVPSDRCCVACSHPVCHDCSHKTLWTRCVFNVDDKNSCLMLLPLLLNQIACRLKWISSRRSRICGDESRRGRNFSWMQDAEVPCCCHLSKWNPTLLQNTLGLSIEAASKQVVKKLHPQALVNSQGQREIEAEIAGVRCQTRFERVNQLRHRVFSDTLSRRDHWFRENQQGRSSVASNVFSSFCAGHHSRAIRGCEIDVFKTETKETSFPTNEICCMDRRTAEAVDVTMQKLVEDKRTWRAGRPKPRGADAVDWHLIWQHGSHGSSGSRCQRKCESVVTPWDLSLWDDWCDEMRNDPEQDDAWSRQTGFHPWCKLSSLWPKETNDQEEAWGWEQDLRRGRQSKN